MSAEHKDDNIEEEVEIQGGKCRVKRVEVKMPKNIFDSLEYLEEVEKFILDEDLEDPDPEQWDESSFKVVKKIVDIFKEIREGINLIDAGKNKTIPRFNQKLAKLKELTEDYI